MLVVINFFMRVVLLYNYMFDKFEFLITSQDLQSISLSKNYLKLEPHSYPNRKTVSR